MKIAILTSKQRFEKYSDFSQIPASWQLIYIDKQYTDQEVLDLAGDADCLFVDAINPVSAHIINNMPNLKLIQSEGVAFNSYDIEAARQKGVYVCNNASANKAAVAEHTIMLMLALLRRLLEGHQMVEKGQQIDAKKSFIIDGIKELHACHIGLIGFGSIGQAVAGRLIPFGCQVSYCATKQKEQVLEKQYHVKYLPLTQMAAECDIISLHVPVLPTTIKMINDDFICQMKSSSFLINTARGEIVDQKALAAALNEGTIAGAGLDTLTPEPVTLENPLLNLHPAAQTRLLLSSHIAGTTDAVFHKMYKNGWHNMLLIAAGKRPNHIVNGL